MSLTKVTLTTPFLSLYLEQECGVLYHHVQQSLYYLSPLSLTILLALDEFPSEQDAIEFIRQQSQIELDDLKKHIAPVKALFQQDLPAISYKDGRYPELAMRGVTKLMVVNDQRLYCRVGHIVFAVVTANLRLFTEIAFVLNPAVVDEKTITNEDGQLVVDFEFVLTEYSDGYTFTCADLVLESALMFEQVLPHLIDRMQVLTFQTSKYQFCFHGAALKNEQNTLLIPGVSGAGKSTLTAILAKQGYQVFSDEMMVFDSQFQLLPIQLPIAVKSGSWPMLTNEYPELEQLFTWKREDGRTLKYIWPQSFADKAHFNQQITLINPCFTVSKESDLDKYQVAELSVIASIQMLTASGYQVHDQLPEQEIEQLMGFLSQVNCYRLNYHSTAGALNFINQV